jgi:hypothetical protein
VAAGWRTRIRGRLRAHGSWPQPVSASVDGLNRWPTAECRANGGEESRRRRQRVGYAPRSDGQWLERRGEAQNRRWWRWAMLDGLHDVNYASPSCCLTWKCYS